MIFLRQSVKPLPAIQQVSSACAGKGTYQEARVKHSAFLRHRHPLHPRVSQRSFQQATQQAPQQVSQRPRNPRSLPRPCNRRLLQHAIQHHALATHKFMAVTCSRHIVNALSVAVPPTSACAAQDMCRRHSATGGAMRHWRRRLHQPMPPLQEAVAVRARP